MRYVISHKWISSLGLLLAISSVWMRCSGPCDQLADLICRCEKDFNVERACRTLIDTDSKNVHPSRQNNEFCTQKLKTCSCQSLAQGNREACGFNAE